MTELLDFIDLDSGSNCFAIVKRTGDTVGLMINVIGQTDLEVFMPVSAASELGKRLLAAAESAPPPTGA